MEKPENFIFPAPYFDENSLPSYKNYLIQIPTGKKNSENSEETIPCLFKKCPNSKILLILFHCNGADMFSVFDFAAYFNKKFNINVLIPEYPGYSTYKSQKSSEKCLENSLIIYDFCLNNMKNISEENIYILGRSLGTGPAVYLSSKRNPAGTFLLSPYTSFAEVARKHHKEDFYKELTKHLRSIDFIDKVKCPLCIFHGNKDNLIHCSEAEKLFNKCENNEKKELHLIDGMDHNNILFFLKEMNELAKKFIEKYCPFKESKENDFLDLDQKFYYYHDNNDNEDFK